MWQALRAELQPKGVEIVTVALDADPERVRPWLEAAQPEHPSLLDRYHRVDELFGIVNVPNSIWLDEGGTIVRPAEPANVLTVAEWLATGLIDPKRSSTENLEEGRKIRVEAERYLEALRDWAEHGAASRFALSPDRVVERSGARSRENAEAAARFELGRYLLDRGDVEAAQRHWREAHRLQPENWTYKRQAWSLAHPSQGRTDIYDSSWLDDVREIGAENYYPPLDL